MKRFLTLLFTTLLLSAALCVTASASDFDGAAKELSAIGMFRGTDSGFELDRAPTRSEAAIMLVRLYGAEEEAAAAYQSGKITHPFTDVGSTAAPYVAWLYQNGISKGTSATTFGSGACSAQNYIVFLLRALGYEDGKDFQYDDAASFAMTHGLFDVSMLSGPFLRDDLAAVTYQALACDLADGSTYLLDSLIDSGAIDAKAAQPITEKIETYRTLAAASATNAVDANVDLAMKLDMTAKGLTEGESIQEQMSMSMDMDGRTQMILDETPKMAITMKLKANDGTEELTTETATYLRDGWVYTNSDGETYKVDQSQQLESFTAMYQALLDQAAVNSAMLPYIDTLSAKESGGSTVYTMSLGKGFEGLFNGLFSSLLGDQLSPEDLGMDLGLDVEKLVYTYTLTGGKLKSSDVDGVLALTMKMAQAPQNTMDLTMKMTMDMSMKINALGDQVKVTYPAGLDQYPELSGGVDGEIGITITEVPA